MEKGDKLLSRVMKKLRFLGLLFGLIRHDEIIIGIIIIIIYMVIYLDCGG